MRSRFDPSSGGPAVEVWLAERDAVPVALMLLEDDWLHSLYVAPGLTGEGIGTMLLDLAKSLHPAGLGLWAFQSNTGARRFYGRHGFGEVRWTDGSDNEEGEPDVEMAWPDPAPIEGLRRRVDTVDDRLARLLAERARLTAGIQRLKEVPGHAGRDRAREARIVERMARLAPELGPRRLATIMDAVISVSLDAAERAGDADPPPDS
jgi:chorismate mutase